MHVTALNGHAQPINASEILSNFSNEFFYKEQIFEEIEKPFKLGMAIIMAVCIHQVSELHLNI